MNCQKYTRGACGHMFKHYERATENGEYVKFGNLQIDTNKSHLNYNLAPKQDQYAFTKQRCEELKCMKRSDVNVVCSWLITQPKNLPEEERELFFKIAYNYLLKKYGSENVVSAYVHMDESTPHMHFCFVPVVKTLKKGIEVEKVVASKVIYKNELKQFHPAFKRHVETILGHSVEIINGNTKDGNKTIAQLKRESETLLKEVAKIPPVTVSETILDKSHVKVSKQDMPDLNRLYAAHKRFEELQRELIRKLNEMERDFLEKMSKKEQAITAREKVTEQRLADATKSAEEVLSLKNEVAIQKQAIDELQSYLEHLQAENTKLKKVVVVAKSLKEENEELRNFVEDGRKIEQEIMIENQNLQRKVDAIGMLGDLDLESINGQLKHVRGLEQKYQRGKQRGEPTTSTELELTAAIADLMTIMDCKLPGGKINEDYVRTRQRQR